MKPSASRISRRTFVSQTALTLAAGSALSPSTIEAAETGSAAAGQGPLIVSTWGFGKPANEKALAVLQQNGSLLDAVEQGIWIPESDPKNASVGLSGIPNAAGVVQLDSCIMSGPGHQAGSVAALEGIVHPISAARRVMEKTPHVMLAGPGARLFALEQGLESIPSDAARKHEDWHRKNARQAAVAQDADDSDKKENHDTIALLVLGSDGNLAGGCSTSGWGGKLPGRVGDSPIIGSGLYVDNEVGAAGATGLGENVMRYCASFMVVEFMRQGMHPEKACLETIRRIARQDPKGLDLSINFVALDKKGRYGAAGTGKGFPFAVTTSQFSRVITSPGVTDKNIGAEGGNR